MKNSQPPIISAIVAMGKNRVIGKNNALPWHLPADLKHFKEITTGHPIVMGRKTYESIGRPLPNRSNIIMTHNASFRAAGCIIAPSIQAVLQETASLHAKEIFIIGGATIYQQWLPYVTVIYLTLVLSDFAGDTYFPQLHFKEWREIEKEDHNADNLNPHAYRFLKLEKI